MADRWNPDELLADLLSGLARAGLGHEAGRVEAAFRLAALAHAGQTRSDGPPYLVHPLAAARIVLEEWGQRDADLVCAALLHDALEDGPPPGEGGQGGGAAIEAACGPRVRALVELLTKQPVPAGGDKAARDAAYFAGLGADAGARLVKAADRLDNVRSLAGARWSAGKKRAYAREALEQVLPAVRAGWEGPAAQLEREAREVLARLEEEEDLPDAPPEPAGAGPARPADPVWRRSAHLSFFRRGEELFLYHDLVGDIMQLHEEMLPFLDFFAAPRRESEARAAFAGQFHAGDLDQFFTILPEHLCLLGEGQDDQELTAGWAPLRGPWIVSHQPGIQGGASGPGIQGGASGPGGGALTLAWVDRRDGQVVVETLSALPSALFALCTGELTLPEVVARLAPRFPQVRDLRGEVLRQVRAWTHSDRQLLKLLPRRAPSYELVGLPPYAYSTMPFARVRAGDPPPAVAEGTRQYHRSAIVDAEDQFERRETTISHALRVPHPALEGRPYGGRLCQVFRERELLVDDGGRGRVHVVEVGGGTGFLCRAFLDRLGLEAPRLYNRLRWTIVDLSPALRAAQRERTATHAGRVAIVGGDAVALPFADGSVDCLLSNEVIADLPVAAVRLEELEAGGAGGPAAEVLGRLGVPWDDAPGLFHVNVGALRFLEEVARVLRPGGSAWLSEYGHVARYPERSLHLDHDEWSIHFGQLRAAASRLGLESSLEELAGFLRLQGHVPVLQTTQSFFAALRALLARHGVSLTKVAWTREMLQELLQGKLRLEDLGGLSFKPCGERLLGLKPPEFKALVLRKPLQAGRAVRKVAIDV